MHRRHKILYFFNPFQVDINKGYAYNITEPTHGSENLRRQET